MSGPVLPGAEVAIARVDAFVLRSPIATPVRTSFGVMHDRPAVFVRVEDADGAQGWGEVWCNFPSCGAEHRERLVRTVLAPLLQGRRFPGPVAAYRHLADTTAVLAIQSGEHGPLAQAIAGVDIALWDLCARRAGQPLWRFLGGSDDEVPVYASGINPDRPEALVAAKRSAGFRSFKLKVGFGRERDVANLQAVRDLLGAEGQLMVDANQAWTVDQALAMLPELAGFGLRWLEEPLRADRPGHEWARLVEHGAPPLAAGENLAGEPAFDDAVAAGVLAVLQPDCAKWGGISGCWPVAHAAARAGLLYCPHYLGAGIGLLASAHLLAAQGGGGLLEVDANDNPLRSALAPAFDQPVQGRCRIGEAAGLGAPPGIDALLAEFGPR